MGIIVHDVYEEIKKENLNVRHENSDNIVFRGKLIALNTYLYRGKTLKFRNACIQGKEKLILHR